MRNFIYLTIFSIIIVLCFNTSATEKEKVQESIFRGFALRDCTCEMAEFDETPTKRIIKKGEVVGKACHYEDMKAYCHDTFPSNITCPKECLQLRKQGPLSLDEIKTAVNSLTAKSARLAYEKKVPANIFAKIREQYPQWVPILYNRDAPFIASFEAMNDFYFELALPVEGQTQNVSIVYFFPDIDHLLQNKMIWSFWNKASGDLIWSSVAPYPSYSDGYVHHPCLAPSGVTLNEVVLFGISAGVSDASGCCGPFSLKQLKKNGPVEIKESSEEVYDSNVIYQLCSRSTDSATGKYVPQGIYEIDGPANLRKYNEVGTWTKDNQFVPPAGPEKSAVIGSCSDHSRVADLGSSGDWHHVYCEGKSGWTHKKNIRGLNKK